MGIMGGKGNSFPFDEIGDTCTGYIIAEPEEMDQTDQDSGEVKRWPNGQAKKVWKITLQTELRNPDDPEDEGIRTLWVKWKSLAAVRDAVRAAGARDLEVGGRLALCFSAETDTGVRGKNKIKEYTARYASPPPGSKNSGFMDAPAKAAPASAAPETLEESRQKNTVLERLRAAGINAEPVDDGFGNEIPF